MVNHFTLLPSLAQRQRSAPNLTLLPCQLRDVIDITNQPNPDASKLLILAALEDAAVKGLNLEPDDSTLGLTKLYSAFGPGISNRTMRLQCERNPLVESAEYLLSFRTQEAQRFCPTAFALAHQRINGL
jgi:hypothetical protein